MNKSNSRYYILNKPTNMVSQFIGIEKARLLKDLDYIFPEGIHAIGRLDSASEGLLLLTTNKKVTKLLFKSKIPHKRTYLVKVRYIVSEATLQQLRSGVTIHIHGGIDWITSPCEAEIITNPTERFGIKDETNEYSPYTWLLITLTEGKYHQVRKMVFALRHRCKRLIRVSIEDMTLGNLQPSEIKEIEENDFFNLLKITNWK